MGNGEGSAVPVRTIDGREFELNGMVGLEFLADGNRGAEMRDRLAQEMPCLISAYELLGRGVCAIVALQDIPGSLAEFAYAWSVAGLTAEIALNGPFNSRGELQEYFGARLSPEGASPSGRPAVGYDPEIFIRGDDEQVVPLDWRHAGTSLLGLPRGKESDDQDSR